MAQTLDRVTWDKGVSTTTMNSIRTFEKLPRALKAYLLAWYAAGAIALIFAFYSLAHSHWQPIVWFVVASWALSFKAVRGASGTATGKASVSMASAAAFAAIIGVCPVAGALVEAGSTVLDSVFPKRRALYQALFNISVVSVGALTAGLVYHALRGPTMIFGQWSPLIDVAAAAGPMLIATTAYFLVNTIAVAEVVALASESSFNDVWTRNFKATFLAYATGGSCSILLLGLSGHMPAISLMLLCAPIIYVSYSREQTDEARVVALEKGKERLRGLYLASIRTLALTIAAKDTYTNGHIHRVTAYAVAIARKMGISEEEITDIQAGALLHDIGKIGVPEHILTKPGKLEADEMALMRRHSEIGWAILEPLEFPDIVKQIVRNHHEWYDGTGYPDGIRREQIPLMVGIVSVSDVFDALTSDRPYRPALSIEESREIMRRNQGTQFDPEILRVFLNVLDTVPVDQLSGVPSGSPVLTEILSGKPAADQRITPAPHPVPVSLPAHAAGS